ncbi:hypothetical protein NL676_034771 [Syzygium grande]|nr:hypothetical protein NL676_034771 [Syzygium grande]
MHLRRVSNGSLIFSRSVRFNYINTWIHKISSINGKNSHFLIFRHDDLEFRFVRIIAPEDSPNTDGIHIGDSSHIKIADSMISTGDDCVSVGPGSRDVEVVGTQNRVRIKSWASPLKSNAYNISFYDITMKEGQSPIIIDQWYCPVGGCSKQVAINLVCSPNVPCKNIVLDNIDLTYPAARGTHNRFVPT